MLKFVLVYADYLYYGGDGKWSQDLAEAVLFDNPALALDVLGPIEAIAKYHVKAVRRETVITLY